MLDLFDLEVEVGFCESELVEPFLNFEVKTRLEVGESVDADFFPFVDFVGLEVGD